MTFQDDPKRIKWRMHFRSPPETIYRFVASDDGRLRFWAESTVENGGEVRFQFPNGQTWVSPVLEAWPPKTFHLEYFGGSTTTFHIDPDGEGGTELTLIDEGIPASDREEVIAGWVSVLMALKAAADYGVDLRNHDPNRTWAQGYGDN
jgi:uncharacterized protein YndB with AHSA1/START domain